MDSSQVVHCIAAAFIAGNPPKYNTIFCFDKANFKIDENWVYWPYTIILVYTIILISKTGNPTRLFQHHDYSRREST